MQDEPIPAPEVRGGRSSSKPAERTSTASLADRLFSYASSGGVMDDTCRTLMREAARVLRTVQAPEGALRVAAQHALVFMQDEEVFDSLPGGSNRDWARGVIAEVNAALAADKLVPIEHHNRLTAGPADWTATRVPADVFMVAQAVYGTGSEEDDKRVYRTLQAALWKLAAQAPAPAHGPSLPSGWRVQRNEDGSIGLFAPPPVDGESRRTSELFTGKLGSDMNEIVFKLLTHMLDAAQAPAVGAEPKPDRTGMTYYRKDACTAVSADAPDCICWSPSEPPAQSIER